MSRFYTIAVDGGPTYTSLTGGLPNPGALNIEMDVQLAAANAPTANSYLRIWGIPLTDIAQARNLNPTAPGGAKKITVSGGMVKGLPLAVPSQGGLLFQANILQCFGNWQGTDQTLEFFMSPCPQTQDAPGNFVIQWKKGTPLSAAIATALTSGLPGLKQNINISDKLVFTEDVTGVFSTLKQLSDYIYKTSKFIIKAPYQGVSIYVNNGTINVSDNDNTTGTQPKNTEILFTDLIGQMTWLGINTIQAKTVLRYDISVGDYVTLPAGQIATTGASLSQFRQGSVFQGKFFVQEVRHVGNFRMPNGDSWCSIYTLTAIPNG